MKLNETNAQLTSTKESLVKEQKKVKIQEMRLKEMNDQLHLSDRQSPDETLEKVTQNLRNVRAVLQT